MGTWFASASATLFAPARLSANSAAPHARPMSFRNGSTKAFTPARAYAASSSAADGEPFEPAKCNTCQCESRSLFFRAKATINEFKLEAPCEAPVTKRHGRTGSSPNRPRHSARPAGAIAERRSGIPTMASANFGISGVSHALTTRCARRAATRFARPGVASKFTSVIGMRSERAAAVTGPVTNPPRLTTCSTPSSRIMRFAAASPLK